MKKILLLLILPFTLLFASIGKITIVSGDVVLSKNGKEQKAVSGALIDEKDQVLTKTGSTAQLIFNDGTAISLGAKSTFKVEEYLFDEKGSNVNAKFKVSEGAFRAITGKIGKMAPDKFKLDTRTATIGIRGTRFLGVIPPNAPETIACTKGAITVTIIPPRIPTLPGQAPAPAPAPQTVNVQAGQVTTVTTTSVAAPKAYTPADIKKLESAAGGDVKKSETSEPAPAATGTKAESSTSQSSTSTAASTPASSSSLASVPASTVVAPAVATPPVAQIVQSVTNTVTSTTQAVTQQVSQAQTQEAASSVLYGVAFGGTSSYSGTGTFSNTLTNGVTTYQNSWNDKINTVNNAISINSSTFDGTTFKWSGSGSAISTTETVGYSYTSSSTTPTTPTYSYTLNSITPTTKSFTYTLPSPAPTPSTTYTGYYDNIISVTPYTYTYTPTVCTGVTSCTYAGSGAISGFIADSKQETVFFYDVSSNYNSSVTYTDTTQTSGSSTDSGTDVAKFSFTGTPTVAKNFFTTNSSAIGSIYGYLDFEQILNLNQNTNMAPTLTTNTAIDSAYFQKLFLNVGYTTTASGVSYTYTPYTTNGTEIMFGNQGYYYGPSGYYGGSGGYYANSPYLIQTSGSYSNPVLYTDGYSTPFMVARVFADRASLLNVQLGSVVIATTKTDANGNLVASARNITARYTSDTSFPHSSDIAVTASLYGSEAQAMAGSITDPTSGITHSFASMRTPSPLNNNYDSAGNLVSTYVDRTGTEMLSGYAFPIISSPSSTTVPSNPDLTLMGMSATVNHDKGLVSATMGYGTAMQYTLGSDIDVTQSAYVHNNLFAAASKDGKAYMYAFDTQNATDYVSWGYWAVDTGSDGSSVMPFSVWVAGVPTPTSVLDSLKASNTSYTYNGGLRGVMQDTAANKLYSLDGAMSNINFTVNYGSGTITNGTINAVSQAGTITSSLAGTMDNVNNIIQAQGTQGTAQAAIQGKIYGPQALQAGGVFKALDTAKNLQAAGAFKAIKQ